MEKKKGVKDKLDSLNVDSLNLKGDTLLREAGVLTQVEMLRYYVQNDYKKERVLSEISRLERILKDEFSLRAEAVQDADPEPEGGEDFSSESS